MLSTFSWFFNCKLAQPVKIYLRVFYKIVRRPFLLNFAESFAGFNLHLHRTYFGGSFIAARIRLPAILNSRNPILSGSYYIPILSKLHF